MDDYKTKKEKIEFQLSMSKLGLTKDSLVKFSILHDYISEIPLSYIVDARALVHINKVALVALVISACGAAFTYQSAEVQTLRWIGMYWFSGNMTPSSDLIAQKSCA